MILRMCFRPFWGGINFSILVAEHDHTDLVIVFNG